MTKLKMKSEYNLLTKHQMAKMQRVGDTDKRFLKRFARKSIASLILSRRFELANQVRRKARKVLSKRGLKF